MLKKAGYKMSNKHFELIQKQIEDIELDNNLKDYHAFIFWFIETSFGYTKEKILNSICDGAHDKGVDAVLIDSIEQKVLIIQSKYERKGGQVQINENEIKQFTTVRSFFESKSALNGAINNGNQVTKKLMKEAFDAIRKKKYSLELIFISTHKKAPQLDDLIYNTFSFKEDEFRVYHYERIIQLSNDRMRDFTPSLGVYNLPFVDSNKLIIRTTPHKSWVVTITIEEIRSFVNKYDEKLFRKNVRLFLGKNRTNKKIIKTLDKDPMNFWYFNNGITILCDNANIVMEKDYIRIENPQIVNGCQTCMSINEFNGDSNSEIMVRIIESTDHEFINFLTLYQNSSNPVRNRDLKSNDPVQVRLKHEFKRQKYYFEIKRGEEYDKMVKKYPAVKSEFDGNKINNELIAKLLAAIKISPAVALSSGSDKFFGDYYDRIFTSNLSTFNCLTPYYLHEIIRDTYAGNTKEFHLFEKDWVFKNRAIFYVLDFIHKSMTNAIDEKNFVSFYENVDYDEYQKFYKKIEKIINQYFEYIYKTWDKKEYYNAYLQKLKTKEEIIAKYGKQMTDLDTKTQKHFQETLIFVPEKK